MVAIRTAIIMAVCVLYITLTSANVSGTSGNCQFVYTNWTACAAGRQNRTISCACGGKPTVSLSPCLVQHYSVSPISRECDEDSDVELPELECKWKWTKWVPCTKPCDTGNTSRWQVCVCQGYSRAAPDEYCLTMPRYGKEATTCNEFACGQVPAYNKGYWILRDDEGYWPIPDATFNCSHGIDPNDTADDIPRGKKYSEVLKDDEPESHKHFEWYFLAKEWIACKLNMENGAIFTPEATSVITEIGLLLEYCNGWPTKDQFEIYAGKEKLGRINNNIGGLANVDQEMALLENGGASANGNTEAPITSPTLAVFIAVPLVALLVIGIVIGLAVYYVREKKNAVVEQAAFESEDEPSEGDPLQTGGVVQDPLTQNVPLESDKPAHSGDESSGDQQ